MRNEKLIEQMYERLSGEMNQKDLTQFDQQIASDQGVRKDWVIFLAEQYLDGELTEEKYKIYRNEFPKLPEEVTRQREIRMMLKASVKDKLRVELKEILPQVVESPSATVKPLFQRTWVYAVAAAVIILLALPFIFNGSENELSNQEVFAENFQPMDMRLITRGTDTDSLKEKIQALYKAENYQASLPLLEQLISREPDNVSYQLYKGICYIGKKPSEPKLAIPIFQKIQEDFNFGQAAQWYLALAYILDDNPTEGNKLIESIAQQEGHSFRRQAVKLVGEAR